MRIIDQLNDVRFLLQNDDDKAQICLHLYGHPARECYPDGRIWVNGAILWKGTIDRNMKLDLGQVAIPGESLCLQVEFFGKTADDTVVQDGMIQENKRIALVSVSINNVEITGYNLSDFSVTDYNLSPSQQQAYKEIGAEWQQVHTDTIYDNGIWTFDLSKPIVTSLINKRQKSKRAFEYAHHEVLFRLQQYFSQG